MLIKHMVFHLIGTLSQWLLGLINFVLAKLIHPKLQ
jgi:hypothetical protein